MDYITLAFCEARRADRDRELSARHHHRMPPRPKGRFRGRRRPSS
jgi:hypothetical protein